MVVGVLSVRKELVVVLVDQAISKKLRLYGKRGFLQTPLMYNHASIYRAL